MKIEADVHPLIAGIVRELPPDGMQMHWRRRAEWLRAFEGILGLLYPVPENEKDMHEYVDCPKGTGCEKCYGWSPPETVRAPNG